MTLKSESQKTLNKVFGKNFANDRKVNLDSIFSNDLETENEQIKDKTSAPLFVDPEKFNFVYQQTEGTALDIYKDNYSPTFKIFFHFGSTSGLLANENYVNSALAYLKRIGDNQRYSLLKTFISTLSGISTTAQWIFQSVEGIQELYAKPFGEIYTKKRITINCLETIDSRVASLVEMWRWIVFNPERGVYVLPENIRQFSFSIYIFDRTITQRNHNFLRSVTNIGNYEDINHIMFDFGYATFVEESNGAMFGTLSKSSLDIAPTTLIIEFEKFELSSLFRTIVGDKQLNKHTMALTQSLTGGASEDFANITTKYIPPTQAELINYVDELDPFRTFVNNTKSQVKATVEDTVNSEIGRLFLGNVMGFTPENLVKIWNAKSFAEFVNAGNYVHPSLGNYTKQL